MSQVEEPIDPNRLRDWDLLDAYAVAEHLKCDVNTVFGKERNGELPRGRLVGDTYRWSLREIQAMQKSRQTTSTNLVMPKASYRRSSLPPIRADDAFRNY